MPLRPRTSQKRRKLPGSSGISAAISISVLIADGGPLCDMTEAIEIDVRAATDRYQGLTAEPILGDVFLGTSDGEPTGWFND